jgi:hypothetical protein
MAPATRSELDPAKKRHVWLLAWTAVGLGAVLRWPVLLTPLHSDDYQQIAMLRGAFLLRRPSWNLFWFGPRSGVEWQRLVDFGFDPWWTAPDHRLAMLRPLSSLLIAFDASALGANAEFCHLHSLLWWVALISAVALLLGRLLPTSIAATAVALFALDEAHNIPLSWLANRSTLVAATFGTLALLSHVRAREHGIRWGWLALSLVCWMAALAAGEYAFGLLAYLVAFELLRVRDRLAIRVLCLLPGLGLAVIYLGVRAGLGIGVGGSGLYVGPNEPLRYLVAVAKHAPTLLGDVLLGVPAGFWQTGAPFRDFVIDLNLFDPVTWARLPSWQSAQVVIGVLALLAGVLALRFIAQRAARELDVVRFLFLGSVLASVAAAGTLPSARLLMAPELGACALLATLLVHSAERFRSVLARGERTLAGLMCAAIVFVHGGLAARTAYAHTADSRIRAESSKRWALSAQIPRDASKLDIVIVSASDFATAANLPWLRWFHGMPLPHSYRRLSGALQAHDITRTDAHTVELAVLSNDVSDAFAGSIYRTRDEVLAVGQRVQLPGLAVEVLAVDSGNPWRLRFTFDRELEDPSLIWLQARPEGLRRFTPPRIGETLRLPRAALPWGQ